MTEGQLTVGVYRLSCLMGTVAALTYAVMGYPEGAEWWRIFNWVALTLGCHIGVSLGLTGGFLFLKWVYRGFFPEDWRRKY